MGHSKSSFKRQVYCNIILPPEIRIANKQPILTPKATKDKRTNKTKSSIRKEIIKIRAEINGMRIPDHLICLLRNLCAGQGTTVRTRHGTTDGFKIGKVVH